MAANYNTLDNSARASPYGSGDPYYNESSGFITPQPVKKRTSNWVKIGIPVLILVIAAAVIGGVLGSKKSKSSSGGAGTASGEAAASSAASVKEAIGRFATATDSPYLKPVYPSTVCISSSFLVQFRYTHTSSLDEYRCIFFSYLYPFQQCCSGMASRPFQARQSIRNLCPNRSSTPYCACIQMGCPTCPHSE